MNPPPTFDRRSRPVFHNLREGAIEVVAIARSIPEALAIEAAIRALPVAEAFVPEPQHAPELLPATEALLAAIEGKDADRDMALRAGTANPQTVPVGVYQNGEAA